MLRAAGGRTDGRTHVVFHGNGDARQRSERLARCFAPVDFPGPLNRLFAEEADERADGRLQAVDLREGRFDGFDASNLAFGNPVP